MELIFVTFIIVGFVGTPPGVIAPPLNDTNYVVTNLTCNDDLECTNTTGSSGCSSYGGGYAAITCTKCTSRKCIIFIIVLTICLYMSIHPLFSFIHLSIHLLFLLFTS